MNSIFMEGVTCVSTQTWSLARRLGGVSEIEGGIDMNVRTSVNSNLVRPSGLVALVLALLAGPAWAGDVPFTEHIISTNALQATDVFAADVDGDGNIDLLSSSRADDKIAWYESDGGSPPTFTEHVITTGEDLARVVFAADIDNDGNIDVVTAARGGNRIVWWENDGGSPPTFTEHVISASADGPLGLVAADLDGDGDVDVLYSEFDDDEIVWAESDGGSPPTWDVHIISANANGATPVAAADVNGDGLIDVLSGSVFDLKLAWYESDGGSPPVFTERIISTAHDWRDIAVADLDDDGDADVLSTAGVDQLVVWFENDGESPPVFTEHVISIGLGFPAPIAVADIDNDCDLDVVVGADASDSLVLWYESDGGSPPMFTEHVIAMGVEGPTAVRAIDLDGDGDTDVLSSSTLDSTIAWYENGSAVELDIKPGSCPNSFNRKSHGVLPVALVGTESFDVMDIDLGTVQLSRSDCVGGFVVAILLAFEDAATVFDGELCDCHELGGDGVLDLSIKFPSSLVTSELQLDEFSKNDLVPLDVTPIESRSTGTSQIVTTVSVKPMASCIVSAVPT